MFCDISDFNLPEMTQKLIEKIYLFLPQLASAAIILFAFYLASKLVQKILRISLQKFHKKEALINFLVGCAGKGVLVVGFTSSLGTLGVDVSAIVAGLGVSGLAVSLACKEVIANVISGVQLLLYETFEIEDKVEIKGVIGIVLAIDLRYTTVINEQQELCYIPNSTLVSSNIRIIEKRK